MEKPELSASRAPPSLQEWPVHDFWLLPPVLDSAQKDSDSMYLLCLAFFKYAEILWICPYYTPFTSLSSDKEIINLPDSSSLLSSECVK